MKGNQVFRAALFISTALLVLAASNALSLPSEAARMYSTASDRLTDLKKSSKKKYRSYWIDCVKLFERVEKKHPKTANAADSCFARAGVYLDLARLNRSRRDLRESGRIFSECQTVYPKHAMAPEALFRAVEIALDDRNNTRTAAGNYRKLVEHYPDNPWTDKARLRLGLPDQKRKKEPEIRAAASPSPQGNATVKEVRAWSGGSHTRVVIDLDGPFSFEAHQLRDPDRLFFDLKKTRAADTLNRDPLPIDDGILKQVRSSQFDPDTVRVVLDLASLKSYMAFPLREPDRLVIDVTGQDGPGDSDAASQPVSSAGSAALTETPTAAPSAANHDGGDQKLSLSRQMGLKVKTIAIDAGHGGHDPGAVGKYGLKEKDVTLDVARRLAVLVKEELDCNVIMTRDKDEFVGLEERPALAKTKGADLFVSIHVNAHRRRTARGIETYIQGLQASDRDAMETAARENAMSMKRLSELGSEIERILADLKKDDKIEESIQLAHTVQASLVDTIRPAQKSVVNLGVKRAFFYVLINTEMPSILAEVGFISNQEEEKLLKTSAYRQKIAEALFDGIKKYMDSMSPKMAGL